MTTMTEITTMPMLAARSMFRQHSAVHGEGNARTVRHWLMDDPTGRELIKTAAARAEGYSDLPWFSNPVTIDNRIEPFIDHLGLRDLAEPQNRLDLELTRIYLVWRSLKASILAS